VHLIPFVTVGIPMILLSATHIILVVMHMFFFAVMRIIFLTAMHIFYLTATDRRWSLGRKKYIFWYFDA
jgi:hypothetical protein